MTIPKDKSKIKTLKRCKSHVKKIDNLTKRYKKVYQTYNNKIKTLKEKFDNRTKRILDNLNELKKVDITTCLDYDEIKEGLKKLTSEYEEFLNAGDRYI
jgi:hypothetical protein